MTILATCIQRVISKFPVFEHSNSIFECVLYPYFFVSTYYGKVLAFLSNFLHRLNWLSVTGEHWIRRLSDFEIEYPLGRSLLGVIKYQKGGSDPISNSGSTQLSYSAKMHVKSVLGAESVEWLNSWLTVQEDRRSNSDFAISISENWYFILPSRDITELLLK